MKIDYNARTRKEKLIDLFRFIIVIIISPVIIVLGLAWLLFIIYPVVFFDFATSMTRPKHNINSWFEEEGKKVKNDN